MAAARAVGYVGAGTVEFIVEQADDGAMRFFFMEMNTRLQVEHPVTEAITGQDLVEWQLRVAAGQPLPLAQDDLKINGHAIEARISAETPDKDFLPATGQLQVYRKPAATSFARGPVRIDDGVREGDAISPFYDPMIAKLIVHGDTREQALARLDEALSQLHIVGLNNNVQFLRHVLATPSFAQAQLDTALIPRERALLFDQEPVGLAVAGAAAIAHTLLAERMQQGANPFSRRDGWQSHGVRTRRFEFEFHAQPACAELRCLHDGALQMSIDDETAPLVFRRIDEEGGGKRSDSSAIELEFNGQRVRAEVHARGELLHIFTPVGATRIALLDPLAHAGEDQTQGGNLSAPMPGKVVAFLVKAGDVVEAGQPLAVLEAMKMEHTMAAPADGVVEELLYAPGDQVAEGAELLRLGTKAQ